MRVRVGSYRYSPGWVVFVAVAAVWNVAGSVLAWLTPIEHEEGF